MAVCACLTLCLWSESGAAAGAARWSIQRVAGTIDSELTGVSCPSNTRCTAVGLFNNRSGTGLGFAERWTGANWSMQRVVNRAQRSGLFGGLENVSCASVTACMATGSGGALTLAERCSGVAWSIQRTPNPTWGSDLAGVSCASATASTAVGWAITGATLAEHWDGAGWSIHQTPQPSGATETALSGVSCATVSNCVAVGDYTPRRGVTVPLAEIWDGSSWSILKTIPPAHIKDAGFSGVSCSRATACIAVGSFTNRAGIRLPLAEAWNGASWSILRTPSPVHIKDASFSAVSCTGATTCTAVGSATSRRGAGTPLAERYS